jgi:branched-chain amino acid transport system substrate-binding protein
MIFIPEYYPNVNKIYEQCKNLRITSVFLGGDGWESVKTDEQDSIGIKGGYFFSQYSSDISSPLSSAFANQYLKIYGKNPDSYSALGYDAVKWIINDIQTPESGYDGLTTDNGSPKGVINYIDYDGYVMYEEVK